MKADIRINTDAAFHTLTDHVISHCPLQHNNTLEPVFVYLLCTHVDWLPVVTLPLPPHHFNGPMTSPARRPSPPAHQLYPSLNPTLTQPLCRLLLEQYHSVHLAQGVGGLCWDCPGLPTMIQQRRQKGGRKLGNRTKKKNSPSGCTPPCSTDLCPPINIPYL